MPASRRLDPDELAALEEERDFLLASIQDLEREHTAGDLGDDDLRTLGDDYTSRAAEVIRAIDERRAAFTHARRPRSAGRIAGVVAVVALFAMGAGALVAQAAGRRQSGETISGSGAIPRTPSQDANRCIPLTQGNKPSEAIRCYQAVLERDPANPVALTYLGWTLVLSSGDLDAASRARALRSAVGFLGRAVESDPRYPDARVFRAIVATRSGDVAAADRELDILERLNPPADVAALARPLRQEVDTALRRSTTTTPTTTGGG